MLRAKLPGYVLRELGKALLRYAERAPEDFARLFDPTVPRGAVVDEPELTRLIRICGLLSGDEQIRGNHRIRRQGEHLYLMELGAVEYYQDLWPETDALLAELETLPAGRLLDLGCGCGIVALEAAARGHQVVATDLDPAAVQLSQINAKLNGIEGVDFREGDLYQPVAGETFDAILTAPHYGRVSNQLRVQVLRDGAPYLRPGGKLLLATVLEWEQPGVLPMVKVLDERLPSEIGLTVRPIVSPLKRGWFSTATGDVPGLVSEHRFVVELMRQREGSAARPSVVTWPEAPLLRAFVPLHRLTATSPQRERAVLHDRQDLERLEAMLRALADREITFALPASLHDACRFGDKPCVAPFDGAAGAILDVAGTVRPCAHGEPIGTFDDDYATLVERYRAQRAEASVRRGCATCEAEFFCSRCLNPGPFAEAEYCDFNRRHARGLPQLQRLFEIGQQLADRGLPNEPVRIHRSPWGLGAVASPGEDDMGRTTRRELEVLRELWNNEETWTVHLGERAFLSFARGGEFLLTEVDPVLAAVGEQVADGATATDLHQLARARGWPTSLVERGRRKLATHLGLSGKLTP